MMFKGTLIKASSVAERFWAASKEGVDEVLLSTLGDASRLSSDAVFISAVRVWWYAAISRGVSLGDIELKSPIDKSNVMEGIVSRIVNSSKFIEVTGKGQAEGFETLLNKPMPPERKIEGVNQ